MNRNKEGWHYFIVKKLPALLRETSKHHGDIYCVQNLIRKYVKIKIFVTFLMLSEDTKILKFNQYQKSDKVSFIIYAHL